MADRVFVSNLCIRARHGGFAEETKLGRKLFIDIDCVVDPQDSARDDDYSKAVCYRALCDLAAEISESGPFKLIEALGDRIAREALARFSSVSEIRIQIREPSAPIASMVDHVGIEVKRVRSTRIAFSLGSNVGNKVANIRNALARLGGEPHIEIDAVSHFYQTEPWGKSDQDWFVNACATGRTSLQPRDLLRRCKALEIQIGRTPGLRWGPRVIDIDLLFFGDKELCTGDLTLPHPEMFNRAFVLAPLAEIAPDQSVAGRRIGDAAKLLQRAGQEVARLDDPYL
jgi:dihydroneopterin aldolase/2-amino-4-hydroxy-6-hydroxymethyldihydropteridine diphosphokinase